MANFKPLKWYLIELIDDLVAKYKLKDPFLDLGCGVADISVHLAKKGWRGKAIDLSSDTFKIAQNNLEPYNKLVQVECARVEEIRESYNTIVICDVLEHIEDDASIIRQAVRIMTDQAFVIISTPIYMREWRWDDKFYGHIRRYEIDDLTRLLDHNGLETLEIWDFTYPVFWALRRMYTKILSDKIILHEQTDKRTLKSALHNAWDAGIFTKMIEKMIWWPLVYSVQKRFKTVLKGCECIVLARKKREDGALDGKS